MKRRIFNAIAVLSALLCVGTILIRAGNLTIDEFIRGPSGWRVIVRGGLRGILISWSQSDVFVDNILLRWWVLDAATMLLPLAWLIIFVRHRLGTVAAGHCAKCGYDLRATPDRCPECGKVPVKKSESRNPKSESIAQ